MESLNKPIIGITMGDPAGSGPELVIKALDKGNLWQNAVFVIIGDLKVLKKARDIVQAKDLKFNKINNPSEAVDEPRVVNVIDLDNVDLSKLVYGKPSALGGRASYEYISEAVKYAMANEIQAIVTAPISKESLKLAGYPYPGHTEILATLTGAKNVRMMLVGENLRVVHVTTHVSLKDAIELIKKDRILDTIEITYESLTKLFNIDSPKIAVAGLNPHAGENGLFGNEEIDEIIPAIKAAQAKGINALGPYPPDTVFYRAYHKGEFDAVIAMYHDQGHIPLKIVAFMEGVNVTLGLPIIRTSPDHGTVWGKAGTGTANEKATIEAIRLAIEFSRTRQSQS